MTKRFGFRLTIYRLPTTEVKIFLARCHITEVSQLREDLRVAVQAAVQYA